MFGWLKSSKRLTRRYSLSRSAFLLGLASRGWRSGSTSPQWSSGSSWRCFGFQRFSKGTWSRGTGGIRYLRRVASCIALFVSRAWLLLRPFGAVTIRGRTWSGCGAVDPCIGIASIRRSAPSLKSLFRALRAHRCVFKSRVRRQMKKHARTQRSFKLFW